MKSDIFDKVHGMLRRDELRSALTLVLDFRRGKIKKPYYEDLNHAWYIVGDIYFRLEDFNQALRAFRSAYLNNKDDCQSLQAIGNCYSELGRYKMAERFYRKAITANKKDVISVYNLGNSLFDQKRFSDAIIEYQKVIRMKSTDSDLIKRVKNNISAAKTKK